MPVLYSRITEDLDEWQVLLKLLQSHLDALSRSLGVGQVTKSLGQFMHCPPHVILLLLDLLSIQLQEWTYGIMNFSRIHSKRAVNVYGVV